MRTMNHLKTLLLLATATTVLTACHKERLHGTGNIVTQERNLSPFQNVRIEGPVKARIHYGNTQEVIVRTDAVAVNELRTTVGNNTLVLDVDQHINYQHIDFEVDIHMPVIHSLVHEGVSNSSLSGFFGLDALVVQHDGVGDLNFSGSANVLHINHDGVGDLHAFGFVVDTCHVAHSGVGNIHVTVNDQLSGYLSGVGNLYYQGSPQVNITDTGVGQVYHID
ncbi:MAG: DUF2807 domain-containing protein [Flavobacteriales bacterium]|nr:DUF2807 domain-containing protein [Flavobacteriales bacterium]